MQSFWWIPLASAVTTGAAAATAAVFAAWYTSRQASERSMRERIWDRKAAAYSEIFGALSVMLRWAEDEMLDVQVDGAPLDALRDERVARFREARDRVDQVAAQNIWLLSEASRDALIIMDRELNAPSGSFDWLVELAKANSALAKAITKLTHIAREEMRPAAGKRSGPPAVAPGPPLPF